MAVLLGFTVHQVQQAIKNASLLVGLVQTVMKQLIRRGQTTTAMEHKSGIAILVPTLTRKIVLHILDGTIQEPPSGFHQEIALKNSNFIKNIEIILAQLEVVLIL